MIYKNKMFCFKESHHFCVCKQICFSWTEGKNGSLGCKGCWPQVYRQVGVAALYLQKAATTETVSSLRPFPLWTLNPDWYHACLHQFKLGLVFKSSVYIHIYQKLNFPFLYIYILNILRENKSEVNSNLLFWAQTWQIKLILILF